MSSNQPAARPRPAWNESLNLLQAEKLPEIRAVAQKWFEETDNAFSSNSSSSDAQATHQHLLRLIESAQKLVSSQGLSSIPLLPHDHPSSAEQNSSSFSTKNLSDTNNTGTPGLVSNSRSKAAEKDASSDQQGKERLTAMMELAKDSFERRARLREGAAIVNGILRPGRS